MCSADAVAMLPGVVMLYLSIPVTTPAMLVATG